MIILGIIFLIFFVLMGIGISGNLIQVYKNLERMNLILTAINVQLTKISNLVRKIKMGLDGKEIKDVLS